MGMSLFDPINIVLLNKKKNAFLVVSFDFMKKKMKNIYGLCSLRKYFFNCFEHFSGVSCNLGDLKKFDLEVVT